MKQELVYPSCRDSWNEASPSQSQRGVPSARLVGIDAGVREDTGTIIARMRRARAGRSGDSAEEALSARDEGLRR